MTEANHFASSGDENVDDDFQIREKPLRAAVHVVVGAVIFASLTATYLYFANQAHEAELRIAEVQENELMEMVCPLVRIVLKLLKRFYGKNISPSSIPKMA